MPSNVPLKYGSLGIQDGRTGGTNNGYKNLVICGIGGTLHANLLL
jgi:hypothetical protein